MPLYAQFARSPQAAPQRVPVPLIGGSSKANSPAQQSGRTVNLYPEINEDPNAKAVVALHNCPGTLLVIDVSDTLTGTTAIRGVHKMGDRMFFVANEKIVEAVNLDNNALLTWASLPTFTGRVCISDNNGMLVFGDGTGFYVLDLTTAVLSPVLNNGAERIRGTFSAWIGGITVYEDRTVPGQFYYSDIGDPLTVNGLSFAQAEGDPDPLRAIVASNNELLFIGDKTTEPWAFTGGAGNAFAAITGGLVTVGTAARWSVCQIDNTVIMVGRNGEGEGIVFRLGFAGSQPQRISTPAVEKALYAALQEELSEQITAHAYQDHGKLYYRLNIPATVGQANQNRPAAPSSTWTIDLTAPPELGWFEEAHTNPATGQFERIKADHHVYFKGRHLVAAYDSAQILWQDVNIYRDNTLPLVKFREGPGPLTKRGQRFTIHKLGIEMQVGVGRDGGVQGSDPKIMLTPIWDGVVGNEIPCSIGKIGESRARVEFTRLGSGFNFVPRLSVSDPVKVTLLGAWADVTVSR